MTHIAKIPMANSLPEKLTLNDRYQVGISGNDGFYQIIQLNADTMVEAIDKAIKHCRAMTIEKFTKIVAIEMEEGN